MNKFREAIQKTGKRDQPRSMGFGTTAPTKQRAMLLAAIGAADAVKAALAGGADLGIVEAKTGKAAAKAAGGLGNETGLVGVAVETLEAGVGETLKDAGVSVVVVKAATTSASAVDANSRGHVVAVALDTDETTLKGLGALSVDALSVDVEAAGMTLEQQLQIARLAMLSGRPLVVRVPTDISSDELRVLRDSGVAVVSVPATASAKELAALGTALEEVPPKKKADNDERHIAIVPGLGGGHDDDDDE